MLLLLGLVASLGRGTLSLLHSLLFAFAFEATLLVANQTFLTHFLVSTPDPALKLS
jgi:hypothetical protein